MELIIGGRAQGKLSYALAENDWFSGEVSDCVSMETGEIFNGHIIYNLHELVRRLLKDGISPLEFIMSGVKDTHIIICDEIGGGIVPADKFEREYRDAVGEVCCMLAKKAERVTRVCCGIPVRLK